jgi:hypothetical protein
MEFSNASTLSDITLEKIDYDWIEKCSKPSHLKRALRLLKDDGTQFAQMSFF